MDRDGREAIQYGLRQPQAPQAVHAKDLLDLWKEALDQIYRTLEDGATKGYDDQWRRIQNAEDHIAHAYAHLQNAKAGDDRLMHLRHALCRVAMALYHETATPTAQDNQGSNTKTYGTANTRTSYKLGAFYAF